MTIISPAELFRKSLKAFQKEALQELIDSGALTAEEKEIACDVLTKRNYNKHVRRFIGQPKLPKCHCYRCGNTWQPQRRSRPSGRILPKECPKCDRYDWNSEQPLW